MIAQLTKELADLTADSAAAAAAVPAAAMMRKSTGQHAMRSLTAATASTAAAAAAEAGKGRVRGLFPFSIMLLCCMECNKC